MMYYCSQLSDYQAILPLSWPMSTVYSGLTVYSCISHNDRWMLAQVLLYMFTGSAVARAEDGSHAPAT